MLAKENRITENRQFLKIFKTVRPYHTEHLTFRVSKRNSKFQIPNSKQISNSKSQTVNNNEAMKQLSNKRSASRFGFVISNKIDKRSTRRNGLKRRIRAVIEQKLPEIESGIDVVIQVKKAFDYPYKFPEIEKEVIECLQKTGILTRV